MKNLPLRLFLAGLLLLSFVEANAFCGIYVTHADAKLWNRTSQVILVRDGGRTVVTMSSDYEGEVSEFAMLIPVPEVLRAQDIRVVPQWVLKHVDGFTSPKLVEYHSYHPCHPRPMPSPIAGKDAIKGGKDVPDGVKVEATYTVGEYDIVILSATESVGLNSWLKDNGYKVPEGAEEVLDPYVKEGMKFFVAKVNLKEYAALGRRILRPLQIQYDSKRFMLPIRLGMANAKAPQDLVVYTFTKSGRVEPTNYRLVKPPTDKDIPSFVKEEGLFRDFYQAVFDRVWERGKNAVYLEHAWDISGDGTNFGKCDPCPPHILTYDDLREAGVWWVKENVNDWEGGYTGQVFLTRLHLRYDRKTFPQDLMLAQNADKSPFQLRYMVTTYDQGKYDCEQSNDYAAKSKKAQAAEWKTLQALTGWPYGKGPLTRLADAPEPVYEEDMENEKADGKPFGSKGKSEPAEGSRLAQPADEFLGDAPDAGTGPSTTTWLLLIAGTTLLLGIVVRLLKRRSRGE